MDQSDTFPQTLCSVARAENVVGDIWTVLVLRELFAGNHRFDEIQTMTGATPQMAAARLKKLDQDGLVERRIYNERPLRYEYHLTKKGEDFWPVLMALRAWGETWCRLPGEKTSVDYFHKACGQSAGLGPLCANCGELLRLEDVDPRRSEGWKAEREARRAASKKGKR